MTSPSISSNRDAERGGVPGSTPTVPRLDHRTGQEASWWLVAAVLLAVTVLYTAIWYAVSVRWGPLFALGAALAAATGGLVQLTLVLNLALLLVIVVGLVGWLGGLRFADLSLTREDLRVGVVVTVGAWLTMQAVGVVSLLIQGGPVVVNGYWAAANALAVVGLLVAQLFGNALYEEVVFRAFLLDQVRHKLARYVPTLTPRQLLVVAVLVSQSAFVLVHVPSRLVEYQPAAVPGSLVMVFVMGVLLATLYVRTGNLFVAVGLHAFVNTPTMVFGSPTIGILTAIALVVLLATVWPWAERRVGDRARATTAA
ncbi:CPBP family intramembrane glutamic endopeptidase [Halobium salinum]|uniref:CPBP family intramembrane glutamic endopeptidase n=1 Tax=Halobium salinum TaxID=1364940 RepID=A0ABD5PAN0_9EURY|nr:type II CAAX endopeptidase family protein [Halobium salinum]